MTAAGDGGKGARPRGRGGFRHAGEPMRRGIGAAAARQGFAEPDVLLRWQEIAGAELAVLCHPVRVTYSRGAVLGATLLVQAEGPAALEVEHLAPRILERINSHYGYRAIARLKVTQATGQSGSAAGFAEAQSAFAGPTDQAYRGEPRPPAPVDPEAAREADRMTRDFHSPGLRTALAEMGGFVLSRSASRRRGGGHES